MSINEEVAKSLDHVPDVVIAGILVAAAQLTSSTFANGWSPDVNAERSSFINNVIFLKGLLPY